MRLRSDSGMTLIEVMVAMLVILGGTLATFGTFTQFSQSTRKSQQRAVMVALAQREIEQLRPLSFGQLALNATPSAQQTTSAPLTGVAAAEPVVTGGMVRPGPDPYSVQGATGNIYRYVTWRTQSCADLNISLQAQLATLLSQTISIVAAALPSGVCGTATQTKRLTVVVVPAASSNPGTTPLRVSTIISDTASSPLPVLDTAALAVKDTISSVNQAQAATELLTSQKLYLTDTRCSNLARQTPTSHVTDNTSQTGFTCGATGSAPTLMVPTNLTWAATDPFRDFSTDITRNAANGLILMPDNQAGPCDVASAMTYTSAEAPVRTKSIHTWSSKLSTQTTETPTSAGRASLSLWTSTASGNDGPARMCITVRRASNGQVLGTSDFTLGNWPGKVTQLTAVMDLSHVSMIAGERLLLTLRVPSDSANSIRVLYDHATYPSYLSFNTITGKELL